MDLQPNPRQKPLQPVAARVAALADLDIRLLRVFMTVVEENGYVGAQSRLGLAPSTLSEYVKDLELRLGFTVCLRGRRGFKLTEQGESLYEASRGLFEQMEAFRNHVSVIGNRQSGAIRLGLVDGLITEKRLPISDVIREFSKSYPSVKIHINVEPPPDLETALLEGALDIAVGPFPVPRNGLSYEGLFMETQSLCCGLGNTFYGLAPEDVTAALLTQASFVACDYPSREEVELFTPKMMAKTVEAVTMLVLSGRHIAFLPYHVAKQHLERERLWEIDPSRFTYDSEFSVVARNVAVQDPAQRSFIRLLKSQVSKAAKRERGR